MAITNVSIVNKIKKFPIDGKFHTLRVNTRVLKEFPIRGLDNIENPHSIKVRVTADARKILGIEGKKWQTLETLIPKILAHQEKISQAYPDPLEAFLGTRENYLTRFSRLGNQFCWSLLLLGGSAVLTALNLDNPYLTTVTVGLGTVASAVGWQFQSEYRSIDQAQTFYNYLLQLNHCYPE